MKKWFILLFVAGTCLAKNGTIAYVNAPVVDLLGDRWHVTSRNLPFIASWQQLPLSFNRGPHSCPRIHQLLFNEPVTILESYKDQVLIELPHIFYQTYNSAAKQNAFWAQKKYFTTEDTLKKNNIPRSYLPKPINFASGKGYNPDQPTLCLLKPLYDPVTQKKYSAGTRFVYTANQDKSVRAYIYDNESNRLRTMVLARSDVIIAPQKPSEQRKTFLAILKKWAHLPDGAISYVWGGTSFANCYKEQSFELKTGTTNTGKRVGYYERPSQNNETPKSGFDCSGIIARAAHMAGLPYFFKNTLTIVKNLPRITQFDELQNGDIIFYTGHVMVVSDKAHNTLIEAASYDDGYGRVHEIALDKVFKGISTYQELLDASSKNRRLVRLTKQGTDSKNLNELKLLKLI